MKKTPVLLSLIAFSFLLFKTLSTPSLNREPASVPSEVQDLYQRFVDNNYYDLELGEYDSYSSFVENFNSQKAPSLRPESDWIDAFIESLPPRAKRHYTFVHRSYSIQSGTPMSPRVILFTPNAQTIMTFNSPLDENNKPVENVSGDQSVEVIEWNKENKAWDFAELKFKNGNLTAEKNPAKCAMCHAGTPKPVLTSNLSHYQGKLKPIFPQYPLWPGFYGSVNDIVGVPETKDTIMANESDTLKHIREFLFDDSEELARLRADFDTDSRYLDVVRNEMKVHHENFHPFIQSMKNRPRYRHLIQLSDLYENDLTPDFLKSAPYRRGFQKTYGHYIFRPNFYLSTLMTFYQAQAIAEEILNFPEYKRIKHSFLAAKFNCGGAYSLKAGSLMLSDLNPSFDLIYPNVSTKESQYKQYLLAYQYNLVNPSSPHLPLFSWNLEGNEDIASYHYGNVFSDLNELVLWHLAKEAFEEIESDDSRNAHEDRHAEVNVRTHLTNNADDAELFERSLKENLSEVSRFNNSQWDFATTRNTYYGITHSSRKYKGLPVSKNCAQIFIPAAQEELQKLSSEISDGKKLPHEIYFLDEKVTDVPHIPKDEVFQPLALNVTRQACEACHSNNTMDPQFNTDWHSENYHRTIKTPEAPWFRNVYTESSSLKDKMLRVLDSKETLPVPFGNLMPYGRKPMDSFSLFCEKKIIENSFNSDEQLFNFDEKFNCKRIPRLVNGEAVLLENGAPSMTADTSSEENILNCKCRSLYLRKSSVFKLFFTPRESDGSAP